MVGFHDNEAVRTPDGWRLKGALVLTLTERASRPMLERVTAIAGSSSPAADRLLGIVEAVLDASTDQALQLMFRPGSDAPRI